MKFNLNKLIVAGALTLLAGSANASPSGLVISQVYGGGGNSGATFKNDFIELFNASGAPINLSGYAVQYASATGATWQVTALSGTIPAGGYFLIQELVGAGGTVNLPPPDTIGVIPMSASAGKVVLTSTSTALTGAMPASPAIVDVVGYGTATFFEGSAPASGLSNTLADARVGAGCTDTDSNSADFSAAAPAPRNTAVATITCSSAPPPPNPDPVNARIHEIQGHAHRSPLEGRKVALVPGIVTAVRASGFYMEDPLPDNDPATSEGIFVFTSTLPSVTVGEYLLVSGTVAEFRAGGASGTTNLTSTEIDAPTIVSGGMPPAALPAAVVIGNGGRMPPTAKIGGASSSGTVEAADYVFDPVNNGIDFYESMEGMRVVVHDTVVVGPTTTDNDVVVLGDGGAFATGRSARGGILISADDFNPERIFLDDALIAAGTMPKANVGDSLGNVAGVLDYSFGNYKLQVTAAPVLQVGPLQPEITALVGDSARLTVASFNVENLAPGNGPAKFGALAAQIVTNMRSPDIIGVMEVQDNNGATDDGTVDASLTLQTLIDAVSAAGGPTYAYRQINPVNDLDGGEPGGNIRQVFLFNPARVAFVDRPGTSLSTTPVTAVPLSPGVRLSASPGRVDPANPGFSTSRKPLAGEFIFAGRQVFIIANHLNSKGGDDPLFGRFQPPSLSTGAKRSIEATSVANFVGSLLSADPNVAVIVLGDLNDFEFSAPLGILKSAGLTDLVETLPANERYTYVFEGNSQVLDHILVTNNLKPVTEYDVVHVNAEYSAQTSDHEPEVSRIKLGRTEYTAQTVVTSSPMVFNRATGLFSGSLLIKNASGPSITGSLLVSLAGLPAGIVLQGSSDYQSMSSLSVSGGIAAGATISVPVTFSDPSRAAISYGVRVFEGNAAVARGQAPTTTLRIAR